MKRFDKDTLFNPFILYEDNHLCVAYKPPGFVVPIENHPVTSLEGFLIAHYQQKLKKETVFLRPIHRLDKPVGGIVVFARSSKGLKRLQEAQKKKGFDKFYVALTDSKMMSYKGDLINELIHGDHRAEIVKSGGKLSKLSYRVLKQGSQKSLVCIRLHTGRYHQIRVQFQSVGSPIVGDAKYGSLSHWIKDSIALFHTKIILPHPIGGKLLTFKLRPSYFYTKSQASGGIQ